MRRLAASLVLVVFAAGGCSLGDEEAPPPQLAAEGDDEAAAEALEFPSTATRNTIRVDGADAATVAAGVASAVFPATGASDRPTAVALVDQEDWQSAVAAAVLAGPPIGAPLLLSDGDKLPDVTAETLERLAPSGSDLSEDAQVIRIGPTSAAPTATRPPWWKATTRTQERAAIDRFFSAARGKPSSNVVLYSGEQPEWAMPAGSWAARSGDAALPVKAGSIPAPVAKALQDHERPNVYLLGPEEVIGKEVADQLEKRKLARSVERIEGATPVDNAISFARYEKGDSAGEWWYRATTSRSRAPPAPPTWRARPRSPATGCSPPFC